MNAAFPLACALGLAAISGLPGLFASRWASASRYLLTLAAVVGLGGAAWAMLHPTILPAAGDLVRAGAATAWTLAPDALSGFFLIPLFLVATACAWTADDHAPGARGTQVWFGLIVAGIGGVFCASGPLSLLLSWEVMAVAAFFAISGGHRDRAVRRAGWLYIAATRVGTLALIAFCVLWAVQTGSPGFARLPAGVATSALGTLLFLLALLAFGLKAGVVLLHFWLPSAHASAPAHVSALLSGVLIKTGIYGLVRLLSLFGDPPLWWGGLLLGLGVGSGLLGVLCALAEHDLKRLLAYHSIENIGIILIGLGLGLIGLHHGDALVAALGLGGGLLHVLNHALFKSLLFLAGGAAVHGAGTRELDRLGGLARRMPAVAALFALGAAAISGLPPFNGFVSEFLIYQGLFAGGPGFASLAGLIGLALIGALCLACFAKATGAVFLGEPRTPAAAGAHAPPGRALAGMAIPALACLVIGLAPGLAVRPLAAAVRVVAPATALPAMTTVQNLALGLLPLLVVGAALWWWLGRRLRGSPRTVTWDCGYAAPTARMQYTASSFAAPIVSSVAGLLQPQTHAPHLAQAQGQDRLLPTHAAFHRHVPDLVLDRVLRPLADGVVWLFARLRLAHPGSIHLYLAYIVITLVALLIWSLS